MESTNRFGSSLQQRQSQNVCPPTRFERQWYYQEAILPPEIIPGGISYLIFISQFNRGFVLIMQLYDIQAIQITIQKYIGYEGVLSSS